MIHDINGASKVAKASGVKPKDDSIDKLPLRRRIANAIARGWSALLSLFRSTKKEYKDASTQTEEHNNIDPHVDTQAGKELDRVAGDGEETAKDDHGGDADSSVDEFFSVSGDEADVANMGDVKQEDGDSILFQQDPVNLPDYNAALCEFIDAPNEFGDMEHLSQRAEFKFAKAQLSYSGEELEKLFSGFMDGPCLRVAVPTARLAARVMAKKNGKYSGLVSVILQQEANLLKELDDKGAMGKWLKERVSTAIDKYVYIITKHKKMFLKFYKGACVRELKYLGFECCLKSMKEFLHLSAQKALQKKGHRKDALFKTQQDVDQLDSLIHDMGERFFLDSLKKVVTKANQSTLHKRY